jgi:hypothetical protein
MLDDDILFHELNERLTPEELCEALELTIEDLWSAFYDRIREHNFFD